MKRPRCKLFALAAALLLATALSGCVKAMPYLMPEHTLPPLATPTLEPTPTAEPTLEPTPTVEPTPANAAVLFDAFGNAILSAEHFEQYIEFRNIQVYEQEGDTFVDAVAWNSYSETLVCAAEMEFFDSLGKVADAKLQTRDGQYVLKLAPGETTIFAQVNTDMSVTALEFKIAFDESFGITPE